MERYPTSREDFVTAGERPMDEIKQRLAVIENEVTSIKKQIDALSVYHNKNLDEIYERIRKVEDRGIENTTKWKVMSAAIGIVGAAVVGLFVTTFFQASKAPETPSYTPHYQPYQSPFMNPRFYYEGIPGTGPTPNKGQWDYGEKE